MLTRVRLLGPRDQCWSAASLGMLWALMALPASADFNYIDSANPVGIPDLTQRNEPICGAAAMANTFWEWSNHAPFNGVSQLFRHTDQANFATNWGNDSISETLQMAHHIYGEHPTQTRLTANAAGGATNLNVLNTAGFALGSVVFVSLDNGDELVTSVAAIPTPGAPGVIQIAAALPSPSSQGRLLQAGGRTTLPGDRGRGEMPGALSFARNKRLAFNATTNPNGLSVHMRIGWNNIAYSELLALVTPPVVQSAVLGIRWYQANGTVLRSGKCTAPLARVGLPCNGNAACDTPLGAGNGMCPLSDVYHAVTLAGLDDTAENNTAKKIAISNPWGDRRATDPNTPVSTDHYDKYTLHLADIMANDRITIKKAVPENAAFVSAFDALTGQVADQIRVDTLWRVKKGPSPHVTGTVVDHATSQTVSYLVENPDSSSDIHHVYLLLDGNAINVADAASAASSWLASNQPGWRVEVLNPNAGPEVDLFDVTNANDPDLTPAYELGVWSSGAQGLHFSAISEPVTQGGSVRFELEMPGLLSLEVWSDVYIVATEDRSESWAGVTANFVDGDLDSIDDAQDNCLGVYNPDQLDTNQDGYGNACDADYNDDGVVGVADFLLLGRAFGRRNGDPGFNPNLDSNGDGAIGVPEYLLLGRSFGRAPGPSALGCAGTPPCSVP